ncbi:TraB/GumN family protein, partial [Longimicrobium sp.]|uniref:TraB/GumN family protein n=1 Tax=Longimicrobium sp. TaxID=2029185 RepID=UPI002E382234
MMFSQLEWARAGLEAKHGIDVHFEGRAQADGKPLGSLESVDFQMGLMDGFSPEMQVEMLRQTLYDLPGTAEMMDRIVDAWRAGDATGMDALMNGSMGSRQVYDRMLTDRNAAWVPQIERLLRGGDDVLVVVGAAHLVGDRSVVEMLRRRGYTVEQL